VLRPSPSQWRRLRVRLTVILILRGDNPAGALLARPTLHIVLVGFLSGTLATLLIAALALLVLLVLFLTALTLLALAALLALTALLIALLAALLLLTAVLFLIALVRHDVLRNIRSYVGTRRTASCGPFPRRWGFNGRDQKAFRHGCVRPRTTRLGQACVPFIRNTANVLFYKDS